MRSRCGRKINDDVRNRLALSFHSDVVEVLAGFFRKLHVDNDALARQSVRQMPCCGLPVEIGIIAGKYCHLFALCRRAPFAQESSSSLRAFPNVPDSVLLRHSSRRLALKLSVTLICLIASTRGAPCPTRALTCGTFATTASGFGSVDGHLWPFAFPITTQDPLLMGSPDEPA